MLLILVLYVSLYRPKGAPMCKKKKAYSYYYMCPDATDTGADMCKKKKKYS